MSPAPAPTTFASTAPAPATSRATARTPAAKRRSAACAAAARATALRSATATTTARIWRRCSATCAARRGTCAACSPATQRLTQPASSAAAPATWASTAPCECTRGSWPSASDAACEATLPASAQGLTYGRLQPAWALSGRRRCRCRSGLRVSDALVTLGFVARGTAPLSSASLEERPRTEITRDGVPEPAVVSRCHGAQPRKEREHLQEIKGERSRCFRWPGQLQHERTGYGWRGRRKFYSQKWGDDAASALLTFTPAVHVALTRRTRCSAQ
jgi:hypothetical protein